ncbi:hypothetical protein LguiA_036669 [Lonicera macranthoides]
MFSSQYNGNSGGGFTSTQTIIDSTPKYRESQGLVPVTVKQISDLSQSGDDKSSTFLIASVEVTNVTVVGMVSRRAERVTDIAFILDDGTGRIDCNRWINEGFDSKEMEDIQDGMYVRVNGRLKTIQEKRQLVAFSVRPVTNYDELSFHFIECIHFCMNNSGSQMQGDSSTMSIENTPAQNTSNTYRTTLPTHISGDSVVDGLKAFEQLILNYLQQPSNSGREKGVHKDELSQKLKIPSDKIMESLRILEEEGLIYSTIDEFHFKST